MAALFPAITRRPEARRRVARFPLARNSSQAKTILAFLLAISAPAFSQPASPPATTAPAGLDSLSDDRLFAELADRRLDSLLTRAFEINHTPKPRQESFLSMMALRQLSDPNSRDAMNPAQRQALLEKIVAGIDVALQSMQDPEALARQAEELKSAGVDQPANTIEYWGENAHLKAELKPIADAVVKLLDRTAVLAHGQAEQIANHIKDPSNQAMIERYTKMDQLASTAEYSARLNDYYRVIAMDRADPQRKQIADDAIKYLKQFDTAESTVQPAVRLRMAKLSMARDEFATARTLFDSIADNPDHKIQPDPTFAQQYEARYFRAVTDLLVANLADAKTDYADLLAWQKNNIPPDNKAAADGARAAASMLEYRMALLAATQATDPAEKSKLRQSGITILMKLVDEQPRYRRAVFDQVVDQLPDKADMKALDPLLLQAIVQRGEQERLRDDSEKPDTTILDRAIAAARELVRRKGQADIPPRVTDDASFVIPFLLQKQNKKPEAAAAFMDYVRDNPGNLERGKVALSYALALVGELKTSAPNDSTTQSLYARVLPLAVDPPMARLEFAYELARLLQDQNKPADAAKYFRLVPRTDKRTVSARFYEMVALNQELATEKPDDPKRKSTVADILKLADEVNAGARSAIATVTTDPERHYYQSLVVKTSLLAAALSAQEEHNPKHALEILTGFEDASKGLPGERDLLAEALKIRVNAYMDSGDVTKATDELVTLLEKTSPEAGADLMYKMMKQLNDDLDVARRANDVDRMRQLARSRATLSGYLVEWAKASKSEKIRSFTYRYRVLDAESKRLAASLETDPTARAKGLTEALALYESLNTPEARQEYLETIKGTAQADDQYDDPVMLFGTAMTQYDLAHYSEASQILAALLNDKKLGPPTILRAGDYVDNDNYWEATLKLFRSNIQLAKSDTTINLDDTRTALKRLYIQFGNTVGGKKWRDDFEALRNEITPDFHPEDSPATAP